MTVKGIECIPAITGSRSGEGEEEEEVGGRKVAPDTYWPIRGEVERVEGITWRVIRVRGNNCQKGASD